jgi:hypothetical protein
MITLGRKLYLPFLHWLYQNFQFRHTSHEEPRFSCFVVSEAAGVGVGILEYSKLFRYLTNSLVSIFY